MSIEVRSISKTFGSTPALNDVSFEVPTGSLTALLGPSGGGKSTVLRIIAGLEVPDSGTVLINGDDVTRIPARARGIGFCFQHYAPFRHMTVWENVAFGLKVRKRPKAEIAARVHELLELVRLDGFAKRYPAQLSGGQRQRMALARALAVEPKVLLLDEPFGALDAQVRQELRTWLRELHDEVHVTTVLVTHDQEEAMEVADTIAIISHGELEQVGTPAECYDHPANEFVLRFLGPATLHNGGWVRPHDLEISTRGRSPARGRRSSSASSSSDSRSASRWSSPTARRRTSRSPVVRSTPSASPSVTRSTSPTPRQRRSRSTRVNPRQCRSGELTESAGSRWDSSR